MTGLTPRPGIMDIAPYVGGASSAGGEPAIKLSSNESPLGPGAEAVRAFKESAGKLHRYPDGSAADLRQAIAKRFGVNADNVICGDGSDEILQLICRAYAGPGDEVIITENGFLVYEIAARGVGAQPVTVSERDYRIDVDAILEAITANTRIVFIANPSNPTGTYLPGGEIMRLHDGLPGDVCLVIDEAYADFVTESDFTSSLGHLVDNQVTTRTFSKLYGLASLRLGWAHAAEPVIDVLNRLRGPFNVSGPAQAAGIAALADHEHEEKVRRHVSEWRGWLNSELSKAGLHVVPSAVNFLLISFGDAGRAAAADEFCRQRGLILRRMDSYGLPDCLRLTIGLEEENRAVAEALAQFARNQRKGT